MVYLKTTKKFSNERLLKDKQSTQKLAEEIGVQLASEDCFRLEKYDSTKQRPLLVTCPSIWDARLRLSKAIESKLHGRKKISVIPLSCHTADKEKEKKLLKKRFEMIQSGCIKNKIKIHNFKLSYDN